MLILGTTFFSGDLSVPLTPTDVSDIIFVELANGVYDDLYVSTNTDTELTNVIPNDWGFDTVLHAKFNDNTNAGNVDFTIETVSELAIKRREKGTLDWTIVHVQKINIVDDFNFEGVDRLAKKADYEYAIVPYLNRTSGNYNIQEVTSDFNRLCIVEKDTTWTTFMTDGFCDTTRNTVGNYNQLLNSKYPIYFSNSIANFDTGSCTGSFIEMDEETCTLKLDKAYEYRKNFIDFLTDGKPKLLKHFDGRIWLIQVMPNPTDSANDHYSNREISFEWVEIGDYSSNRDLYNADLLDVDEEYWVL